MVGAHASGTIAAHDVEAQVTGPGTSTNRGTVVQMVPPLLRLPAELRNYIYEIVLSPPRTIAVHASAQVVRPSLPKVCRQISDEASEIYFSKNIFHTDVTAGEESNIIRWLFDLGQNHVGMIREFRFVCEVSAAYSAWSSRRERTNEREGLREVWSHRHWVAFLVRLSETGLRFDAITR